MHLNIVIIKLVLQKFISIKYELIFLPVTILIYILMRYIEIYSEVLSIWNVEIVKINISFWENC